MQTAAYYRSQAARADGLGLTDGNPLVRRILRQLSRDYVDIAVDLERGAIKIVHESELPQQDHTGPLKMTDKASHPQK
jgi:hypothetical protein